MNRLRKLTNGLINELDAKIESVCPLEDLYNSCRVCVICTKMEPEYKFLYSSTCSHIFCANCVNIALKAYGFPYRCMMCRATCTIFTYVCKDAERYRIKLYQIENRAESPHCVSDSDDIASLIQEEDESFTDQVEESDGDDGFGDVANNGGVYNCGGTTNDNTNNNNSDGARS